LPDVAFEPDHAPEAVQLVESLEVHANVVDAPGLITSSATVSDTVGSGGAETVIETLSDALPPAPEQVSVNPVSAVRALIV
jgi:hypothetical protein